MHEIAPPVATESTHSMIAFDHAPKKERKSSD
jgi:hypothetical protein